MTDRHRRYRIRAPRRELRRTANSDEGPTEVPLVRDYADRFLARRTDPKNPRRIRSGRTERSIFRRHIVPRFGSMRLDEVQPQEVARWVQVLEGELAPKTVLSILARLKVMFDHARFEHADTLIGRPNPAVLPRAFRPPKKASKDWVPEDHVFTHEEAMRLCNSELLHATVRVRNAIALCTGARSAELAGLRARHIVDARPLRKMMLVEQIGRDGHVDTTKTNVGRMAPIHPELDRLLREWEIAYRILYGTRLEGDALITPRIHARGDRPSQAVLSIDGYRYHHTRALKLLGMPHRRVHDWRKTFESLAEDDGADPRAIRRICHTSRIDVQDIYVEKDWPALCKAVSCLRVRFDTLI